MDPVTIIGLAASVIQLIDTTKKVVDGIKTFTNGPLEMATLGQDLSVFAEALISFERVLKSKHTVHRISGPVVEDMLLHTNELIQELENRIAQIRGSSSSTKRRAKWVQHKSTINKLHAKLTEKTAMLHTFLSITHAETFMALTTNFPNFMLSPLAQTTEDVTTQIKDSAFMRVPPTLQVPTIVFDTDEIDTSNDSSTSKCDAVDTASLLELSKVGSSMSSVSSFSTSTGSSRSLLSVATTSTYESAPDPAEPESQTPYETNITHGSKRPVVLQDMFVIRRSCHYSCHCQCHEEPVAKPRRRRFMGSQGDSKDASRCNDVMCMGNETLEDASKEYSHSFRKIMSSIMSAKSVNVHYELKIRMVPEASDPMRYVKHGNLEKLKGCIDSGEATIWDTAPDGWSLLHAAAYHRQVDIVKYLLNIGAATHAGDVGTRLPVDFAVLKSIGHNATAREKTLVGLFGDKDSVLADFEFTPIHTAVLGLYSHNDRERPTLQELIQLNDEANNSPVDTNWAQWKLKYKTRSPLFNAILEYFRAAAFGSARGTKIIHNLIDQKDRKYHWTPLHWAAYSGRVKEMHILIDHGADPLLLSNLGANIIHAAVESNSDRGLVAALEIWRRCPEMKINQVNVWGETALHVASCISASCVELLLDAGADPNVQDENGQVALHFAGLSEKGAERLKIASVLCSAKDKTHINIKDYNGRPPVFDFLDDTSCVEYLISHEAKADVIDDTGRNAFHYACIHGEDASLQTMLQLSHAHDAAVATSNNGNTPLIEALSNSHVGCATTLLKLKDVGPLVGNDGWAPVHYAARIDDPDLLKLVCQHPSFKRSVKTLDGKSASMVAMEAGTWKGVIKDLIREYDSFDWEY